MDFSMEGPVTILSAIVDPPFLIEPLAHPGVSQHLDRAPLEHSGADPAERVFPAPAFEDDALDAVAVEDL